MSSALIAILVIKLQGRPVSIKFIRRVFFSKKYWVNESTRTDIKYFFINCGVKSLLAMLFVSAQLVITMSVAFALQQNFGSVDPIELPWFLIASIFTLTFFVIEDLSRFLLHWAMHRIPFLWQFHRLHHSAEVLTPLTLHRVHPIEICLYYVRGIFIFGAISGFFIYIFGSKLSALDILGVDALGFLFNMIAANLRHSHIWMSFGRLEKFFISPAQHQIHHSSDIKHHDTNFGTCLALWDRLFGSWIAAGMKPKRLRFGISQPHDSKKQKSYKLTAPKKSCEI
ncbi:MAG: sterol desaturase [Gammaproteobacteria bacterium]|nr:sterol desaturase [Gammaproteobacteria bacterium]